jgi:predicted transcriptional regulator of viral defense system
MIESIRNNISYEEFDYQMLLDCLQNYTRPRDKISDLLRKGLVIRVKKGLYIFGDNYRRRPYSREILANLIYGPSYISLEFALHYFGLIPERVEAVTSVTCGRSRKFSTPIGLFTYRMIPLKAFSIGMSRIELEDGRSFLMAVPEKALADKIRADRGTVIQTQRQLYEYLVDNLRIDAAALPGLNAEYLAKIARCYRSRKVKLLSNLVCRIIKRNKEVIYA